MVKREEDKNVAFSKAMKSLNSLEVSFAKFRIRLLSASAAFSIIKKSGMPYFCLTRASIFEGLSKTFCMPLSLSLSKGYSFNVFPK